MTLHSDASSKGYSSNTYSQAVNELLQQIRQQSSFAADCIEQISVQYGTRAAYLAAFALDFLKQRQTEHHYAPSQSDIHAFTYCEEMRDTAEAIRLYDEAAAHLFTGTNGSDGLRPDTTL